MIKITEAPVNLATVNLTQVRPGQLISVTFDRSEKGTGNCPEQIVLAITKAGQMKTKEGELPWPDCALATMPVRHWNQTALDPNRKVDVRIGGAFPSGPSTREAMETFLLNRLVIGFRLLLFSVGPFGRGWYMPDPIKEIALLNPSSLDGPSLKFPML